jgi:hypothetical protein
LIPVVVVATPVVLRAPVPPVVDEVRAPVVDELSTVEVNPSVIDEVRASVVEFPVVGSVTLVVLFADTYGREMYLDIEMGSIYQEVLTDHRLNYQV